MADSQQLERLKEGTASWNAWREEHERFLWSGGEFSPFQPDLREADLGGMSLQKVNLSSAHLNNAILRETDLQEANLSYADMEGADLWKANLTKAQLNSAKLNGTDATVAILSEVNLRYAEMRGCSLNGAYLDGADLYEADLWEAYLPLARLDGAKLLRANLYGANLGEACLSRANLQGANLTGANLSKADLSEADLRGAKLVRAILVDADLRSAKLSNCHVYGVAAWNVTLEEAEQDSLIITGRTESKIAVDNLEVAQFVYLLLNNPNIRNVIDTVGEKGVLILGRFTAERKKILDGLRQALRQRNLVPMVFDFDKPVARDFTETVMTLAGMSLFVIADITNPRSAPLELQATVPNYMIPFVPIIQEGEERFSMFRDLKGKFDWVLDELEYDTLENLLAGMESAIIQPALEKHKQLLERKAHENSKRHIHDYIRGGVQWHIDL